MGTGIYNITYFPGIFRAFDPSRAVLSESTYLPTTMSQDSNPLSHVLSVCTHQELRPPRWCSSRHHRLRSNVCKVGVTGPSPGITVY